MVRQFSLAVTLLAGILLLAGCAGNIFLPAPRLQGGQITSLWAKHDDQNGIAYELDRESVYLRSRNKATVAGSTREVLLICDRVTGESIAIGGYQTKTAGITRERSPLPNHSAAYMTIELPGDDLSLIVLIFGQIEGEEERLLDARIIPIERVDKVEIPDSRPSGLKSEA